MKILQGVSQSTSELSRTSAEVLSALEKLGARKQESKKVSRGLAPLFIVNPLQPMSASGFLSTHPPLDKRVEVLRSMGCMAGYVDYEAAYRRVHGAKTA